ncbi:MAG: prepilin-type N-terminal cleavage/methylation domain-containing protein [Acidimicrobiia bacterium]|nr:prepilin-type N-terminal cleavage/methylation domain-containing protein [Acidimicrobiia bacterium]
MMQELIEGSQRGDERGFSLVELMVVVLVIAILIAMAIPTFLGARQRADDRAAQSNARSGLTAEDTVYADTQQFTADVASLSGVEPGLGFVADEVPGAAGIGNEIAVSVSTSSGGITDDTVVIGVRSKSGTCYYIKNLARNPATQYASSSSCPATNGSLPPFTGGW